MVTSDRIPDCDVLVVGAGPSGLTLALLLARRGVKVIVAEKEAGLYPLPRAAHIDHQIVRVLQEIGIEKPVLATCRSAKRYDFLTADGQVLLRMENADRIGAGGWPMANMIHQPSIEQALRDAVDVTPNATLLDSWRFEALDVHADQVAAEFATNDGQKTLTAKYLVGADGARSPVREALGIEWDDLGFDEPWLVVDAIVKDEARLPTENLQICDPARPTTCVLMGAGRHRWEFMIKPGETPEQLATEASVSELLKPWNVEGAVEIERMAVYRFNAMVAKRWRIGRIMLAGDAVHRTPPFAGQGLCSGVRDSANLAWKLAAVLRDGASENLLDTYQPEREPNVRSLIGMAMMMGRMVCVTDPAAAAERDKNMLAARAAGLGPSAPPEYSTLATGCILANRKGAGSYFPQLVAAGKRLDDALGSGAWLIIRDGIPQPIAEGIAVAALDDPVLTPFADALGAWLDAHEAESVLVRPDRYVFGTGKPGDLAVAWGNEAGRGRPTRS